MDADQVGTFVERAYIAGAKRYVRYRKSPDGAEEQALQEYVRGLIHTGSLSGRRFLDLGCGFNGYLEDVPIVNYVGIDISQPLLAMHPLRSSPKATFVWADLSTVDYRTFNYDCVLAVLALNYIRDLPALFAAIRRPHVEFCVAIPNSEYDVRKARMSAHAVVLPKAGFEFVYYPHTVSDLDNSLAPYQLRNIRYSPDTTKTAAPYVCLYGKW